ncbi:MAG: hypothetical protein K2G70_06365 [Turicibacter sp.]|nr:hypothetical protein [Turicibacter sp.]
MIYKLVNHLKSVSVEGEQGIEYLRHDDAHYENEHVCIEIKEVSHNEIQIKVLRAIHPIYKIRLEFLNPMQNIKLGLDALGQGSLLLEEPTTDQCYVCSDQALYALGIKQENKNHATFMVDPNHIKVEIPVNDTHQLCCHLLFEKYLSIHPAKKAISNFKHHLATK